MATEHEAPSPGRGAAGPQDRKTVPEPFSLIIFGASGDLTRRAPGSRWPKVDAGPKACFHEFSD